jgi:hypothetical protein
MPCQDYTLVIRRSSDGRGRPHIGHTRATQSGSMGVMVGIGNKGVGHRFRRSKGVFAGGRYWDRTSDLFGVNEALSR